MNTQTKRNLTIVTLKRKGYSYAFIANKYHVSKERIKQICNKVGVGGEARITITKFGEVEQKKLFS